MVWNFGGFCQELPHRDVFISNRLLIDPSTASQESMETSCVDTEKSTV